MFHSFKVEFNAKSGEHEYNIIDSDFNFTIVVNDAISIVVAKEYAKRNLPVARNLALLCLYIWKRKGYN